MKKLMKRFWARLRTNRISWLGAAAAARIAVAGTALVVVRARITLRGTSRLAGARVAVVRAAIAIERAASAAVGALSRTRLANAGVAVVGTTVAVERTVGATDRAAATPRLANTRMAVVGAAVAVERTMSATDRARSFSRRNVGPRGKIRGHRAFVARRCRVHFKDRIESSSFRGCSRHRNGRKKCENGYRTTSNRNRSKCHIVPQFGKLDAFIRPLSKTNAHQRRFSIDVSAP